jgi:hypothetical protein
MTTSALWIIPCLPFVLTFARTWSIRKAFNDTVWFTAFWLGALALIYAADVTGLGLISTSPVGPGGAIAIGIGFIGYYIGSYRWNQRQKKIRAARAAAEAERRRRIAAGEVPEQRSLIVDAFRLAGQAQRARRNAKR